MQIDYFKHLIIETVICNLEEREKQVLVKYIKLQEEKCELMKDTADMIANDLAHAADKGRWEYGKNKVIWVTTEFCSWLSAAEEGLLIWDIQFNHIFIWKEMSEHACRQNELCGKTYYNENGIHMYSWWIF